MVTLFSSLFMSISTTICFFYLFKTNHVYLSVILFFLSWVNLVMFGIGLDGIIKGYIGLIKN